MFFTSKNNVFFAEGMDEGRIFQIFVNVNKFNVEDQKLKIYWRVWDSKDFQVGMFQLKKCS